MNMPVETRGKFPILRRKPEPIGELVGAFESDTVAVFVRTAPVNEHLTVYIIGLMLGLAVFLCAVVHLDVVVTSLPGGQIVPTVGYLYVSPYSTGIVKKINVRVGDTVKKGQSLATLDPTFTQADLLQLKEHLASDEAQIAREEAELAGRPYRFSKTDQYQAIQGKIWLERQNEFKAQVANYNGQIHSAEAQMAQAQSDAEKYSARLKLATEAAGFYPPLVDKGYVSKLQAMQAEDTRTEVSRLKAVAENQVEQYRETITALQGQRDAYIQQWWAATSSQLVADRNDLDVTRQGLEKAQKLHDLTSLDAPEDAVVLQVGSLAPGSIAAGGGSNQQNPLNPVQSPLFTLIPLNAPVEAEIWIQSMDVSFIRKGDRVLLKLDAYNFLRHGTIPGVVKTISDSSFTTDNNNVPVPPYFKVRVAITGSNLHDVPRDFKLTPGNTLVGDIYVYRRTILSYLVEGAMRTGQEAMREPD